MKEYGRKFTCDYCDKDKFIEMETELSNNKNIVPYEWFLVNQNEMNGRHFCSKSCVISWLNKKAESITYGMANTKDEMKVKKND